MLDTYVSQKHDDKNVFIYDGVEGFILGGVIFRNLFVSIWDTGQ